MSSITLKVAKKSYKLDLSALDQKAMEQMVEDLDDLEDGPIVLKASDLCDWLPGKQEVLWQLWGALTKKRSVKLRLDGTLYAKPLDAVLAGLVDGADPHLYERALLTAAIAIRSCYSPTAQAPCVEQLFKKLKALGVTGVKQADLLRLVRGQMANKSTKESDKGGPNPTLLAADFIKRFERKHTQNPSVGKVLHYFNGTFYSWDRRWKAINSEEMEATVVKDLQDHGGVDEVTASLVRNVLTNLQGPCLVGCGDEPLPFYIEDYGPPTVIRRRQLLTLQNGMLDLEPLAAGKKPVLLDFDSRWFGTSVLPFKYDPMAKCPKFKKLLYQALECDPETGQALHPGDCRSLVLQEWFGYTLLCDARFQKFLLMVGEGNNGKGVIQNLWIKMLGQDNVSHVSLDQLSGRFALHPLLGKLANICGDLCEIDSVAEGVLKRLTGQDNIMADRKNLPMIPMAPSVKLIFATNALPRFKDKSRGVWRRLIVMPFRISVPEGEENETLVQELEAELPGIFNWALRGLRHLLKNGQFMHCAVCAQAKQEHQYDCDPVMQFLDEEGFYPVPEPVVPRSIPATELYAKYKDWCKDSGRLPLSSNEFNRRIIKLPGIHRIRASHADVNGKRPYIWRGIGKPMTLPPSIEEEDDKVDGKEE